MREENKLMAEVIDKPHGVLVIRNDIYATESESHLLLIIVNMNIFYGCHVLP